MGENDELQRAAMDANAISKLAAILTEMETSSNSSVEGQEQEKPHLQKIRQAEAEKLAAKYLKRKEVANYSIIDYY